MAQLCGTRHDVEPVDGMLRRRRRGRRPSGAQRPHRQIGDGSGDVQRLGLIFRTVRQSTTGESRTTPTICSRCVSRATSAGRSHLHRPAHQHDAAGAVAQGPADGGIDIAPLGGAERVGSGRLVAEPAAVVAVRHDERRDAQGVEHRHSRRHSARVVPRPWIDDLGSRRARLAALPGTATPGRRRSPPARARGTADAVPPAARKPAADPPHRHTRLDHRRPA
jgi:hypothetical protein